MATKDPAAVSLGSRGGQARTKNMSRKARVSAGKRAVQARWARWRRDNDKPPKPGDEEFL
jgi:hypothetical protein